MSAHPSRRCPLCPGPGADEASHQEARRLADVARLARLALLAGDAQGALAALDQAAPLPCQAHAA